VDKEARVTVGKREAFSHPSGSLFSNVKSVTVMATSQAELSIAWMHLELREAEALGGQRVGVSPRRIAWGAMGCSRSTFGISLPCDLGQIRSPL
jgi:hypothetical protein